MPAPMGNKNAKGNKGGGRPTKFKKEFSKIAYQMCLLGAKDEEIAKAIDVSVKTLNEFKKLYVEFNTALKEGKQMADAEVSASLYQRAVGYSHDDVDIKVVNGRIVKTKIRKHYPPDTTAAIFWLKNRQKHNWRDKQEHGFTDLDGKDILLGYGKEDDD